MQAVEPRQTRWDLRWRMFGVAVRIHPLYWMSSALIGLVYYQDPEFGGAAFFAFWMVAALVSLLLHECGHVVAARLLGAQPRVFLHGLGGETVGTEELPRWRRLAVLLAGPLASFLVVAVLWAITLAPFPAALKERGWEVPVATGMWVLLWGNFCWGVLNLLPLWPLDGGRLVRLVFEGALGQRGTSLALLTSVLTTGLLTVAVLLQLRLQLINRFDVRYMLHLEYGIILLGFCFALWASSFRALWGDSPFVSELPGTSLAS